MKYRSKPVVIDAEQMNPTNHDDIVAFAAPFARKQRVLTPGGIERDAIVCQTLNGKVYAFDSDFIIKTKDECYPCPRKVFKAKYLPVE